MENNITLYCGDVFEILPKLPSESIDCVVTSPPYWAVRDYGNDKQIGMEEHPQEYIDKIVKVMKECKRIIKLTGTIWLNLGDSYYSKSGSGQGGNFLKRHEQLDQNRGVLHKAHTEIRGKFHSNWLQNKQRLLIPYRIAIKCQDELGLVIRNDIYWIKQICNFKSKDSWGSTMPTSVQDRLNSNEENIFLFVKNNDYYFNLDAIRIPHKSIPKSPIAFGDNAKCKENEGKSEHTIRNCPHNAEGYNKKGKNPGNVIMFPTEPSRKKHFAMFPTTLPDFCIKAGCPEGGIVLDPFAGGGTTGIIALKLNRKFIGIELNQKYIDEIIIPRLKKAKEEIQIAEKNG